MPLPTDDPAPDGRSARWDDHRAARRERVLAAAIAAIDAGGEDVGVATIAQGAGIPRSVIYRLFKDREDLDEQIRSRIVEDLMAQLRPALRPQGSLREFVGQAVQTYVRWVSTHPKRHLFLGRGAPGRRSTGSRVVTGTRTAIALDLRQLIVDIVERALAGVALPEGSAANLAFGMIGFVDGAVNRWVAHPEERTSADELQAFLADTACVMISICAGQAGVEIDLDAPLPWDS